MRSGGDHGTQSGSSGIQLFADAGAIVRLAVADQYRVGGTIARPGVIALAARARWNLRRAGVPDQILRGPAAVYRAALLHPAQTARKSRVILRGDAAGGRR